MNCFCVMKYRFKIGMIVIAAPAIMTLPVIVLFFLAQRAFIQGVSLTGVKA